MISGGVEGPLLGPLVELLDGMQMTGFGVSRLRARLRNGFKSMGMALRPDSERSILPLVQSCYAAIIQTRPPCP
jgi:hypothetical protein